MKIVLLDNYKNINIYLRRGSRMAKKIMVVDDALFMRVSLKSLLTQAGYQVVGEAGNGIEAVQKYVELKPDLVTMDITMPEASGIEAIKAIKAINSQVPIIVCSAAGQEHNIKDAILAGAQDFIIKPFQPDRVLQAIKNYLG